MGFIVSRLYKGQSFFILILRTGLPPDDSTASEFLSSFFSRFKITYTYKNECISYKKLVRKEKSISIIEMHDANHLHLFWDCITGMHSVIYFVHSLSNDNALTVIGQIKCVRDVNQGASLLLVVIQNQMEAEEYMLFKKGLQKSLDGALYRIINSTAESPSTPTAHVDDIFQEFSWALNQAE
ncbi:hypothetical protein NEAUS04_0809 [Nematocida ausubeli]|uniref:Uncharacterized protein n=1 Tax=Nematocida ausubeli (strain ATCC PRA-371 / ERTm2) TaxID=1913371 RepID=H8ZE23_NEMA1|nr:uncharacterized protein NESG_00051 [Nematocida ausubeli]EHY65398.1 hypothetical protein NERG_01844 [Nematocida ausubeli]KAI5132408.1 hypothetical protein NEAUS06_0103 [Nematocida ausubeli]KAI5134768.1 hypothetical protein NEAUS07_0942 [Nematocida ausubeli]KAI5147771.1 hypothetical protein NEAUS05_1058 [Nematocida ausubeli]KAI5161971.1 hypothetical protein NEAUS04_0809 [Nematocida ausubeli]